MKILLPADVYTVINKSIISDEDKKNLIALYEPIVGPVAISLYLSLVNDLDILKIQSKDLTHHHLMCKMKCDLLSIKKARETLESVGLLKTYYKDGDVASYIYEIYSPMSAKEFLSHPIFNVVLYNNIGKQEYENIILQYQKINFNLEGYEDISKKINETFKSSTIVPEFDVREVEKNSVNASNIIDFDALIAYLPKNVFNERSLTKRIKDLINNLAYVYNLDTMKMAEIIRSTLNENGFIVDKELRKKVQEYYRFINNNKLPTLVYQSQPEYLKKPKGDNSKRAKVIYLFENTSPFDFLKAKYHGVNPTSNDLKLIEYLRLDLDLKPAVINVLIEYVLRTNNNKLNRAYVETIAGQWKRSKVETAEEAMNLAIKSKVKKASKTSSKTTNKESLPNWFKQDIKDEEISEEERKELEEFMKGI